MTEETAQTFEVTEEGAAAFGALATRGFSPLAVEPGIPVREPEDIWPLSGGTAWVYRVPGNATLTKPVIIADGFGAGKSNLREWSGLWGLGVPVHPWGSQLHEQGRDVIILGYDSRCAPIRDNAEVAKQCIRKTIREKTGDTPLVVGGLSMGGLVTRYALAQMERQDIEHHQVATYFSYDSPHQGAWIPISLQVFAHFLKAVGAAIGNEELGALSNLINSTAARELLWKHTDTHLDLDEERIFEADPARKNFVDALEAIGSFPTKLEKLLGVANGRGDGQGLTVGEPPEPVKPGVKNLVWLGWPGATLYTQAEGTDKLVATLRRLGDSAINVKTSAIPALDGAPGGTLNSFQLAADALKANRLPASVVYGDVCFVPVASAVDLADPSNPTSPVNDMDPSAGGLTEFKVASQNEGHTLITQELCDWLTERF